MDYQLLVAWPVVELLESLPMRERRRLRDCLMRLARDPAVGVIISREMPLADPLSPGSVHPIY
jgi:hypothetical protein